MPDNDGRFTGSKYRRVPGVASLTQKLLVSHLFSSQHSRANRWSDFGSSENQIVLKWMSYLCFLWASWFSGLSTRLVSRRSAVQISARSGKII